MVDDGEPTRLDVAIKVAYLVLICANVWVVWGMLDDTDKEAVRRWCNRMVRSATEPARRARDLRRTEAHVVFEAIQTVTEGEA